MKRPPKMRYCKKCVYPASSAVPLVFDENGICSGCRVHSQNKQIDWKEREIMLKKIIKEYKSKNKSNYDCIIPVSGGKDSYFQTYYVTKVLGLKPLLVTYDGNNYLPVGERNRKRMRELFDVDHIIFGPSVELLKKLNKKCFKKMGDMNWHAHCGIYTYPVQLAAKLNIPLIIWGEHGYVDLGGMYSMNDMTEMTKKFRNEHACRGYDWDDMIDPKLKVTEQDVLWAKYPSDDELEEKDIRGIFLGFYVNWDANNHTKKMIEKFKFEPADKPFDRTYRLFSNLDDMHENGIHDYMKYIKFGYGRATDHVCKDIRGGYMDRKKGIEMIKKYDHVKPNDLKRWLKYVDMTEKEFDKIADTFRDPRVWWKNKKGEWVKDNIWDKEEKK
jgi:N-acetyl sugar amidotransferase